MISISISMNINIEFNSFLLDVKTKNSICSSSVTNRDAKSIENKEKKIATIIISLRNKYTSSTINNNDTSLADYNIKEKKQPAVITKSLKKHICTKSYNDN